MDGFVNFSNELLFENCKVPGERVVGSYVLDDLKDYIPVHLPLTAEVYLFTPYSICLSAVMVVWNR